MSVPVVVMAKVPTPGRAKTRLVPRLGAEGAAALSRAMTADVLAVVRPLNARVALDGDLDDPWVRGLPLPWEPQAPGDLGARLRHALRDGGIAVGTDAPTLARHTVALAALRLQDHDIAFVPARDGGYVLVAVRPGALGVFDDIPWSTPTTLAASLDRARSLGLRVSLLPPGYDVDEPDDLDLLAADLAALPPTVAPHTRAFLQDLADAAAHR